MLTQEQRAAALRSGGVLARAAGLQLCIDGADPYTGERS